MNAHLLLGCHYILVARSEYLIDFWNAFRAVCHSTDGLNPSGFEYLAHTSYLSRHQDGRVHLAFAIRRGTEHNFLASGNLGWCCQHQYGGKEWGSTTWDIESDLFDRYTLLPAGDTRLRLNFFGAKTL